MSEQEVPPPKSPSLGETALAKHGDMKNIEKLLHKRASTSAKEMEVKRREIGALTLSVEAISASLSNEENPLTPENFAKASNSLSMLSMLTMTKELEYICDCLSLRQSFEIKGKKEKGYARLTVADILDKVGHIMGSESGIHDNQDMGLEMLREIGVSLKAFKDKNGVFDPKKYEMEDEPEEPKQADEHEVLTDEEAEEVEKQTQEKHKK
jgi:uncharacterized protein YfkK (UPF0435 family)